MAIWMVRIGLILALAAPVLAQDVPVPVDEKPAETEAQPADEASEAKDEEKTGEDGKRVVKGGLADEQVKVLKPQDIPAEVERITRLKSKADIKAEVAVKGPGGRAVIFKGVIRNGKLIERIIGRHFVPQKTIDHPRAGVRLWWAGDADGYIFFRYSNIKDLAITGKLTEAERREIMARLKAKKEGKKLEDKQAAPVPAAAPELEKFSPKELQDYLLKAYPEDKGWDQKRYRELKRKQIIENKPLASEEAVFVKYFSVLTQARFALLKQGTKKIRIEPGTADESEGESETEEVRRPVEEFEEDD